MNSETKRHIDAARQVLVGVVPNPTSQIEQITNALIYKFMDDMDQASIKAGGEPSFFIGELEPYAWTRIMDSRIGNQERMNLYGEALVKFSQAKQLPELFRGIFKSAFLPYRSPETLGLFLKEIDYFDYSHPEELGNAYEYLLSIMSSQGDAGQFRTPRHIIDFMVDVINPTKGDKVLDPACGTGGFLVSTYKHILEQHDGKNDPGKKEKPLTPDDRKKLMTNFEGYDIDPTMVRIAQVNMYLHQFKNPKIYQYDSLSQEERWNDKFDVILANPPFMSPKGGIKPHSKFSVPSNRSEVLFVDYIINHLRPKGRAGIIVPEGIIFQSGNAYKQLRKSLVNDGLYAVVSLPSGVFAPYSGVKTSILLFNNELAKLSKEILFVKIENDGFDLGATKRPINKNDLPQALQELRAYQILVETGKTTTAFTERIKKENTPDIQAIHHDKFILAKKSFIAESGDYNLSGDRYKPSNLLVNAKWPMVSIGELCELFNGKAFKPSEWQKKESKGLPIVRIQNLNNPHADFNYYTGKVDDRILIDTDDLLFSWSGSRGTSFGPHIWNRGKAILNQHIFKVVHQDRIIRQYFYLALKKAVKEVEENLHGGVGLVHITKGNLERIKIPLPPLEIQEQVVKELDGYAAIIAGAKQIVTNWKPGYITNPEWEIKNLSDVCNQITDGTHKTPIYTTEGIPFLRVTDITESNESKKFISKEEHKELIKRCKPEKGDVLYTKNGTIGIAKMVDWDYEFSVFVSLALLKPKKEILNSKYLEHFLNSDLALDQAKAHSKAGTITNLHLIEIKQFQIPLPPLEIQEQIVKKIETEWQMVESAKKLIEIYEVKTKSALEKLYGQDD
ncbi:MAG: N-6 DNA methylase [Candidatus Levybacteria bacterium]|nr:N-6 DNA methylase [Candidatus Levybacteria bacterium]